jgi:outer membrane protein insertion porin family
MSPRALLIAVLVLIPVLANAQAKETPSKTALMAPIKIVEGDSQPKFGDELAIALANKLQSEGDAQLTPASRELVGLLKDKQIDNRRISRMLKLDNKDLAIYGVLAKHPEGFSLEVSVVGQDEKQKAKTFFANATSMEDLINQLDDVASQIGKELFNRPVIAAVKIDGNKRVEKNTILNKITLKPGDTFRRSALGDQIRNVYDLGYFEDVQIRADPADQGKVDLVVTLKERPFIKSIEIVGNKVLSKDSILDALTTKSHNAVSMENIRADIEKIKKMYEKEGYYQPEIEYSVKELTRHEAKLVFEIREGKKGYLLHVVFEGRKSISEKELKRIINIKEKSWFWLLDDSGKFTRDTIEENRLRLMAYYREKGFIHVQVGAPALDIDQGKAKVTYSINEGDRFQIREVKVSGDLERPAEELTEMLKTKPNKWFQTSAVGEDIKSLSQVYNNLGYAQVDVEPKQVVNDKLRYVDMEFVIHKGQQISIDKVDIAGNERTRDKVIRRALSVREGDLYNADAMQASKKDLEGMDFFEKVVIKTQPGSQPDRMNLTVEVLEKKTGALTAGIGYSTQEGAVGNLDVKERNLLGMGIVANAKANMSSRRNSYEGSVTYPYLFDSFLSTQLRGYDTQQSDPQYLRTSHGFGVHFSYPIYGMWGVSSGMSRDSSKLSNFQSGFGISSIEYYRKYNVNPSKYNNMSENSFALSLSRDTRNHAMLPTRGSVVNLKSRFAGLGGDVAYTKFDAEAYYYYPVYWKAVVKVKGNALILQESGNDPIPLDRRVTLGGIYSIRGYQGSTIGPKDRYGTIIGGDRGLFANVECLVPLVESLQLNGVVFFDAGNSWNAGDSSFMTQVKAGYGLGVRWVSPMGPLRIEYGWKVSPEKGEDAGAFAFAMGQLF